MRTPILPGWPGSKDFLGEIFTPHPKGECLDPRNLLKTRCGEVAEWPKATVC